MWCDQQEFNGQKHSSDYPFLGQQNYKQPLSVLKHIVESSFTRCFLTAALGANYSLQFIKLFSLFSKYYCAKNYWYPIDISKWAWNFKGIWKIIFFLMQTLQSWKTGIILKRHKQLSVMEVICEPVQVSIHPSASSQIYFVVSKTAEGYWG